MTDKNMNALFVEVHKAINESASTAVTNIEKPDLTYPPDVEMTTEEINALKQVQWTSELKSALTKIIEDSCAYPFFHFLSLLDGVIEPEGIEEWFGLSLAEPSEDDELMLHDQLYDSYLNYKK